jgi:hypothetical protein
MSGLESIGKESHGKMDTSFSMGTISQECIILCTPGKPYKKTQQFLRHIFIKNVTITIGEQSLISTTSSNCNFRTKEGWIILYGVWTDGS